MNKKVAKDLKLEAEKVALRYSNFERENNFNNETFSVNKIIPMSDSTASVIMNKNSGKQVVLFFYLLKNCYWLYFVPSDSHIIGMSSFNNYKLRVEEHNFKHNFEKVIDNE